MKVSIKAKGQTEHATRVCLFTQLASFINYDQAFLSLENFLQGHPTFNILDYRGIIYFDPKKIKTVGPIPLQFGLEVTGPPEGALESAEYEIKDLPVIKWLSSEDMAHDFAMLSEKMFREKVSNFLDSMHNIAYHEKLAARLLITLQGKNETALPSVFIQISSPAIDNSCDEK